MEYDLAYLFCVLVVGPMLGILIARAVASVIIR